MGWLVRIDRGIDAVLCAWLVRRWIDGAVLIDAVRGRATAPPGWRLLPEAGAHPCGLEALIAEHALSDPALFRLALIARGASTSEKWVAPESIGVEAVGVGLAEHPRAGQEWVDAAVTIGDALYAYCRRKENGAADIG